MSQGATRSENETIWCLKGALVGRHYIDYPMARSVADATLTNFSGSPHALADASEWGYTL